MSDEIIVHEHVKMIELPEGRLIIVFTPQGYFADALFIDKSCEIIGADKLKCFRTEGRSIAEKLKQKASLKYEAVKAVLSVPPFSAPVLKIGSVCIPVPTADGGEIYLRWPSGEPC